MAEMDSLRELYVEELKDLWSAENQILKGLPRMEQAKQVGQLIARRAQDAGADTVIFDRGGYRYHGRVKALAEGAREGGLKF